MSEEDWEEPAVIQMLARMALNRRLFSDMTEVMARVIDTPVYDVVRTELTEEWVNRAIREELVEANRKNEMLIRGDRILLENLRKVRGKLVDAEAYLTALLHPPAPWQVFGENADTGKDVVFWGDDGTGLPIWERVKEEE